MNPTLLWKPDWPEARAALQAWWERRGLALYVTAPRETPLDSIAAPPPPRDVEQQWLDAEYWTQSKLYNLANVYWGGVAVPIYDVMVGGPGSLGLFLGAGGHPAPTTVWYEPNIYNPDTHPLLRFNRDNWWWAYHCEVIQRAQRENAGRYLIGFPDLIENIDTLAQLRDPQLLLMDLIERPDWVKQKNLEINRAFFECFDALWATLRDPWGGNSWGAFALWAPGKMAKVQCDFSCMIGPEMFREFVVPALTEQCEWLEYSMYHLDGTQAMQHLPALLEIAALDAIEWTPQAGIPGGGSPEWYSLYKRIKDAGKSVQAIRVEPHEVEPLIKAVGREGLFILTYAETEADARSLLQRVGWEGNSHDTA